MSFILFLIFLRLHGFEPGYNESVQLLVISPRAAYNLCNTTKDFRVLRIGTSIRVNKQSFDNWFAAV